MINLSENWLFEGVGEVVFVEDCVAALEDASKQCLGFVEAVDSVDIFFCDLACLDAFEEGLTVVFTDDDCYVEVATDVLSKGFVELVLLVSEFDHTRCDDDAFAGVKVAEYVDSHA